MKDPVSPEIKALRLLSEVRPRDWQDEDDSEAFAAWTALDVALAYDALKPATTRRRCWIAFALGAAAGAALATLCLFWSYS